LACSLLLGQLLTRQTEFGRDSAAGVVNPHAGQQVTQLLRMGSLGQRDVAHLEHRNHTNIGLSNHKNHYREGVRVANWVEEDFGVQLAGRETDRVRIGRPCHLNASVV
jgi:hypothetical protein